MVGGERQRKTVQAMPAVSASTSGSASTSVSPPRFRLVHGTGSVLLAHGVVLIGRDPECDISFDDPLASRHHARVTTNERGTTVADLGSINGTWINGESIDAPRVVAAGDKLLVGGQELQFVDAHASGMRVASPMPGGAPVSRDSVPSSFPRAAGDRSLSPALDALRSSRAPSSSPRPPPEPSPRITAATSFERRDRTFPAGPGRAQVETTGRVDAFELLGALADKAFALGQNDRAAELVGPYLRNILKAVKDGSSVSRETSHFVARYAVKLAAAIGDPAWLDVTFELFTLTRMVLPAQVIDDLVALRLRMSLSRPSLRRYVEALRASATHVDAAERLLVQRIAGLDPLPSVERR